MTWYAEIVDGSLLDEDFTSVAESLPSDAAVAMAYAGLRTPAGHCRIHVEDVKRVVQIQRLNAAGLRSRVIAKPLASLDPPAQGRVGHPETRLVQENQRLEAAVWEAIWARDSLDEVITETSWSWSSHQCEGPPWANGT